MGNCCTNDVKLATVWFTEFEHNLPSLSGKRIAITGTTSGTGRVAAMTCLKKGAEVFVLNRESKRAQDALSELKQAFPGAAVQHIPCDLMDFASVREAAKQLSNACQGRLDVMANNAGIMMTPDKATKDGFDEQMQTNHLSHFLLTKEMLPALRAAAKQNGEARIVNHSSAMRKGAKLDPKFVAKNGGNIGSTATARYHHSKLANMLFTYELADRLAGEPVKAVVCTPGVSATNLIHTNNPMMGRMSSCFMPCFMQSPEDGTLGLMTCIAKQDVQSGDFYIPEGMQEIKGMVKKLQRPTGETECDDKDSQKLLWEESEKAISEKFSI